jgi:hypothetical protein
MVHVVEHAQRSERSADFIKSFFVCVWLNEWLRKGHERFHRDGEHGELVMYQLGWMKEPSYAARSGDKLKGMYAWNDRIEQDTWRTPSQTEFNVETSFFAHGTSSQSVTE